jgi:hypothetical protein
MRAAVIFAATFPALCFAQAEMEKTKKLSASFIEKQMDDLRKTTKPPVATNKEMKPLMENLYEVRLLQSLAGKFKEEPAMFDFPTSKKGSAGWLEREAMVVVATNKYLIVRFERARSAVDLRFYVAMDKPKEPLASETRIVLTGFFEVIDIVDSGSEKLKMIRRLSEQKEAEIYAPVVLKEMIQEKKIKTMESVIEYGKFRNSEVEKAKRRAEREFEKTFAPLPESAKLSDKIAHEEQRRKGIADAKEKAGKIEAGRLSIPDHIASELATLAPEPPKDAKKKK